jgi:hypothetical protein
LVTSEAMEQGGRQAGREAGRQAGRQALVRLDELLDAHVSFLPVNWIAVVMVTCRGLVRMRGVFRCQVEC